MPVGSASDSSWVGCEPPGLVTGTHVHVVGFHIVGGSPGRMSNGATDVGYFPRNLMHSISIREETQILGDRKNNGLEGVFLGYAGLVYEGL